uniref:Putative ovule protein n=1 Tax=Solanum chacoense TaxID=4108 RepID=A0A0V0GW01_SOLCH
MERSASQFFTPLVMIQMVTSLLVSVGLPSIRYGNLLLFQLPKKIILSYVALTLQNIVATCTRIGFFKKTLLLGGSDIHLAVLLKSPGNIDLEDRGSQFLRYYFVLYGWSSLL